MKMTLFKIVFPSDKTLISICKSETIYTYLNDFLQQELILKLLTSKFESSSHFDMNLLASSTSFNYLIGKKGLQTPYLHYHQKFQKIEQRNQAPSTPFIDFNIKDQETEQKKGEKQFFGHILKQKIKNIGINLFRNKGIAALLNNNNSNNNNQNQTLDLNGLVKRYRAAIKKQKTIQFNNEQTTVKYPNQQTHKRKIQQENKNQNGGSTLNIFKEIAPVNYQFVAKNNHFYQFNIYKKSLRIRSYLEIILYFAVFIYCVLEFFALLTLTNAIISIDPEYIDLMFDHPSANLKAEIKLASESYTPTYTFNDIFYLQKTNPPEYCKQFITLMTNNIQKYIIEWQDDCFIFFSIFSEAENTSNNFNRSIYFIYMIPLGFLMSFLHSKLVNIKINYDLTEYIDIFLVYLCFQHQIVNQKIQDYTDNHQDDDTGQQGSFSSILQSLIYVLSAILFCLFLKIFQFFSRTEKLGVFIKILILTIKQVFAFLILFMLNICAFASVFFLLSSYRIQDYSDFLSSVRTLIATSLGTFDFNETNTIESVIQTIFLYSSNVIMINLLIAIMTKTYSQITERSNVEFALILQEEYQVGKLDKNYSLLIAFPPPLNFFSFLLSWTLFFQKLRDCNAVFIKIGYTIILLVVFIIFFIINLSIVPFTYLKMIYTIILYQLKSIGLNIILQKRRQSKQKKSFWKSYIWCLICQWLILIFKLCQWLVFGLPYLFFHSIFTDSYTFIKSAYNSVENKYFYGPNLINTPIPQRYYYTIKCQPHLIDPRYQTNFITSNYHLVKNYLKFKYLVKSAKKDQEAVKNGAQPVLKNYFLKVLKQQSRRKKNIKEFNLIFEAEYQKLKEIREDVIHNEHTDQSFLAIMRTKQIYYSTEFWQKNKVTSFRQSKFYHLSINPSIKHQMFVQQSLIRQVQSQNQNLSHIKIIQKQMSTHNLQPSSQTSLHKMTSNVAFIKQQTQKKKLKTLYEQTDVE